MASRTGTSEQTAAVFALLARLGGFTTRVVVGYETPARAGLIEVRAHHAHAWVEVDLGGGRWQEFDPTVREPRWPGIAPRPPAGIHQAKATVTTTTRTAAKPTQPVISAARTAGDVSCSPPQHCFVGTHQAPGLSVALLVVALAVLIACVLAADRHRRARRAAEPALVIARHWQVTLRRLRTFGGLAVPLSATPAEVALAATTIGPHSTELLARWVPVMDAAVFALGPPSDHLAAQARVLATDLRGALRHDRGRFRRFGRRRPLGGRS